MFMTGVGYGQTVNPMHPNSLKPRELDGRLSNNSHMHKSKA